MEAQRMGMIRGVHNFAKEAHAYKMQQARNKANMQANTAEEAANTAHTVAPSPAFGQNKTPPQSENTDTFGHGAELYVDGKPYKMPTDIDHLKRDLTFYVKNFERNRKKMVALIHQNTTLSDEVVEMRKTSVKSLKNVKVVDRIKGYFATHMFRRRKFINNKVVELAAAEEMFGYCHTDKDKRKLDEEYKTNWVNTYKDTVTSVCNKRRSTIQGAMRTAVMVFAEKNKYTITVEDVKRCIFRNIDVTNPDDVLLFKWYWTELLGKHVQVGH